MIEFITLFLGGLVAGPQPVEIMTGNTVTAVEVWLDGELEERLYARPWKLEVDLGPELAPHLLEAVALDSKQRELARARQWINMSPTQAQSSITVEGADRGQGAIARVSWELVAENHQPESIEVYFDGQRLDADDPRSIQLPTFDPDLPHHIRVRLEFTAALSSEAEAVFGGAYGNEISTEISAVPIRYDKGRKPESARAMRDWFTVGGEPRQVHAIEKGIAKVVVVRDAATKSRLAKLAAQAARLETDVHLKKHHRISFVSPCPVVHQRTGSRQLVFPRAGPGPSTSGALLRLLATVVPADCTEAKQQLADAVGVAGLAASEGGQRRVVLLLIEGEPRDQSDFTPGQVIAYLERLRVPLLIWDLGPPGGPEERWGRTTRIRKLGHIDTAFHRLEKDVEHQLIVWLEGLHLPQSVKLRPDVEGIALLE